MTIDNRDISIKMSNETLIIQPFEVNLGNGISIRMLYNRYDGEPYMRIVRVFTNYDPSIIHLCYRNLICLMKLAPEVDMAFFDPENNKFQMTHTNPNLSVAVTKKSLDPRTDDDIMLRMSKLMDDGPLLHKLFMHRSSWIQWKMHFERMKKWMEDVWDLKKQDKLQIPVRLNFKTLVQAFRHPSSLTFIREQPGGESRKFTISRYSAIILNQNIKQVEDAINRNEEITMGIGDNNFVSTTIFQGRMYVSFGVRDQAGARQRGTGMNIDTQAFQLLKENMEVLLESMEVSIFRSKSFQGSMEDPIDVEEACKPIKDVCMYDMPYLQNVSEADADDEEDDDDDSGIDIPNSPSILAKLAATSTPRSSKKPVTRTPSLKRPASLDMPPPAPKKAKTTQTRRPVVPIYMWKWCTKRGKTLKRGAYWHFKEAACRNDADQYKPNNAENLVLTIEVDEKDKPTAKVLVYKLARHHLAQEVKNTALKKCSGCLYESKGQPAQQDGGCMADWDNMVDRHLSFCMDSVDSNLFRAWTRNLLEIMDYPVEEAEALVAEWKENTTIDQVEEKLLNDNVAEPYERLFRSVEPRD